MAASLDSLTMSHPLAKDAARVQRMFDRVAPRYDLANTLFSFGQDRHWRRVAARAAQVGAGDVALDAAAGTGGLARELAAAGASVLAVDLSLRMLATGAAGHPHPAVRWCAGDALRLPLADASVDAVTIGFGLRNLADAAAGLAEFARVTRPGGRLVVLEFSRPTAAPVRVAYHGVVLRGMPQAARLFTSDPAAYGYLAASIRAWPDQAALAGLIATSGWDDVRWKNLSGGIVACHRALRRR
jgi:demethylmenaquinone methyltransferase / 2-methoxy-6-polyprenyl-1,4-benzoquinol methylase